MNMHIANDLLIEETECRLLLEGLHYCYGFDFRDYAPAVMRQRIWECVHAEEVGTISGLQDKALHDGPCLDRLLCRLAPRKPSMFAPPEFYLAFRAVVIPLLRTYAFLDIWVPACSTGEDVYALAMMLEEQKLGPRVRIYATDIAEAMYADAAHGRFALSKLSACEGNYRDAGGIRSLNDYYRPEGEWGVMLPAMRNQIVFSEHSLATDGCFQEFQMIVCRHTLSLFNDWLRDRAHSLFRESLCRFGMLGLDEREVTAKKEEQPHYEDMGRGWYRKVY